MAIPIRLAVLRALTKALENIVPTDTEHTRYSAQSLTMKKKVFRGRLVFGPNDPLPMLSIIERTDEGDTDPAPAGSQSGSNQWPLIIQGWVEDDDPDNPTDTAHWLLADVKTALAATDTLQDDFKILGFDTVTAMAVGPGVVRPADEESDKAHFVLTVTLTLSEDVRNLFV